MDFREQFGSATSNAGGFGVIAAGSMNSNQLEKKLLLPNLKQQNHLV